MENRRQAQDHKHQITALTNNLIECCIYVLNDLETAITDEVVASQFPPEIREPLNNIKQLLFIEKFPKILNLLKIEDNDIRSLLSEAIPPIYFSALEESQFHRADLFKHYLSLFFEQAMTRSNSLDNETPSGP